MVVNLFGSPISGKAIGAGWLFSRLMMDGWACALFTEHEKDCLYEEHWKTLEDQIYILGQQLRNIECCESEGETVITDDPLLMGLLYCDTCYYDELRALTLVCHDKYANLNFFVRGSKSDSGANRMYLSDDEIKEFLCEEEIPFFEVSGDAGGFEAMYRWTKEALLADHE